MKKSKLLPLIGVAIFAYLLSTINLGKLATSLLNINWLYIAILIPIMVLLVALKAVKWNMLITAYKIKLPFARAFWTWLIGFSISLITPGKVGDFARAYYIKDKADLGKSLTTVIIDRIIDVIALFVMTLLGLVIFISTFVRSGKIALPIAALFALFVVGVVVFLKKRLVTFIARPFFNKLAPANYKPKLRKLYHDFYGGVEEMNKNKKPVAFSVVITFAAWFISVFQFYIMALALGINVAYTFMLVVFPVILLLEALPISFSGLGTRDAALIFFFSFVSIGPEAAVSLSILLLIVNYATAIPGFILWFKNPIKLGKLE